MSRKIGKKTGAPGGKQKTIAGLSTRWFAIIMIAGIVGGSFGVYLLFFAPGSPFAIGPQIPGETPEVPEVEDAILLNVYDRARTSNTGTLTPLAAGTVPLASLYSYNTTGKSSAQITTLTLGDLTHECTNATANFSLVPEVAMFYFVNVSAPDFGEKWLQWSDATPALFFNVDFMQIGGNYVFLLNKSVGANVLVFNSTIGTNLTISTDKNYKVLMSFDSNEEGFDESFDVNTGQFSYFGIRVNYDHNALITWANVLGGSVATKKVFDSFVYIFLAGPVFGGTNYQEVSLILGGVPGIDYNLRDVSLIYGSPDDIGGEQLLAKQ